MRLQRPAVRPAAQVAGAQKKEDDVMGPQVQGLTSDRQQAADRVPASVQGSVPAKAAEQEAVCPEARQEELRARADALMWAALLGGDGRRFGTGPGNARSRGSAPSNQVCASELEGRTDLTAGEPQLASYNYTVKVSDAEGRSASVTLLNVRSLSRAELARRAVELARSGKGSNLP
jgi:hypothetical protein